MSAVSHFRGHLFADLRGSTAFTERAGNAAGANLVRRFRQLVRDEVATHEGAEVKTEGDAIYVVFPSASTAVMCGLAIVDRAAAVASAEPDVPMDVGVGIHAGEAVEVPEGGYIGTAVNLAARVCSVAQAGEVLVTGTVRGIVRASIPVEFVARGKRRLKGIAEPVELYRVVAPGTVVPKVRWWSRWRMVAAVTAGLVVLLAVGLGVLLLGTPRAPSETPTPAPPAAVQPRIGPLEIGQYVLDSFQPRFGFDVVDPGWSFVNETSSAANLLYTPEPGGTLDIGRISTVYSNPCISGGESLLVVNTSQDLLEALRAQEFIHLSDPTPIFVGDRTGLIIDASIDSSVLAACGGLGGVAVFPIGGTDLMVEPGQVFRIHALDVGDSNVSFVAASDAGPDAAVTVIDSFFGLVRRLVDTVDI